MIDYQLSKDMYVAVTQAGAYYAVASPGKDPSRQLLRTLLKQDKSPPLTLELLKEWTNSNDENGSLELLYHAQKLGWLEGLVEERSVPSGALEDIVPNLLPSLSLDGKALLADDQGFYISSKGFVHEAAEELSALSADIASLHDRHHGLLRNNLGLSTGAWALIDAAGNSQVGFWPLFVGDQRFVLVVGGVPSFNQPALTKLIWSLSFRYGK
ncbi:MAG: hypothetical protein KZQ94_22225 [Candidatus Thiodiazotropha sp. (ex Troendleina suluensis)]|nr:hypothetical protein [Candidatus Thiodiazotropha sp. (ex Troendleina suluensis)]